MTGFPICTDGLVLFIPSQPVKCCLFRILYCGQLAARAATNTCDIRQKKPKTKPCNFQPDISFVLRHHFPCFAEGPGEESGSILGDTSKYLLVNLVVKK